jgi:phage shock protein C
MKKLYLSTTNKKLGGVCGGVGEYFGIDPTLIRLLTILLAALTAFIPVFIGYLVAWAIIPVKPPEEGDLFHNTI